MKNTPSNIFYQCLLGLFILFTGISCSYAQQAPSISWQKCYGGSLSEYTFLGGSGISTAYATQKRIIPTSDGGFAFVGTTTSVDGDVVGNHGSYDLWIVKINHIGNIEWQRCLGSSGAEYGASLIQTSDHGYAVIGNLENYSFPNPPVNDGDVSGNLGGNSAWLVKLDSTGSLLWQHCFGGTSNTLYLPQASMFSIIESNDSGLVVAGEGSATGEGFPSRHGQNDAYVVKFEKAGYILWQRYFGGTSDDAALSIIKTRDNGFVFVGATHSDNTGDVLGHHDYTDSSHTPNNDPTDDVWMVQLNSNGELVRQKCIGGTWNDVPGGMCMTSDGGYILTANTNYNDGDFISTTGKRKEWIIKLDSAFNIQWKRPIGGSQDKEEISSIIQSVDGGYVFLARTTTVDGEVMGIHLSRKLFNQKDSVYFDSTSDIWVVKLLQTGEIEWQKCLGGYDEEFPSEIIQTSDSGYVILGSTYSNNDGDVSGYHGGGDLWVVKLGGAVNSVNSYSPSNNSPYREFNIFPNPSNDIKLSVW